ncbi:MAG: Rrf2 family transcriptional regulator [Lachnospiraceae bacterium]|nr:Rrf2 family transcriptional regulator [Lachnospiraceae bacterium]
MIITTKGKNALKFMLDLSIYQGNDYVKLRDIASREDISEKYLEHIVSVLQKSNKVKSARGVNGGYRLTKEPCKYSVGEIIRCLEGEMHPTSCTSGDEDCPNASECLCYPLWRELDSAINDVLDNTSLQDLLDKNYN